MHIYLLCHKLPLLNWKIKMTDISVVIPTCNRKARLLSLLQNLHLSTYPITEVIIVDSGEERLDEKELAVFSSLKIIYCDAEKSVCIQRNKGIRLAKSEWIFLCDDDIEVPADYLDKLVNHINRYSEAVAVSGLVLQLEKGEWKSTYSINSTTHLLWNYIFKLTMWEEISCKDNFVSKLLKKYYHNKGNHIADSGFPVITNFSGDYFTTPVYGLGASLIKREWLIRFPYAEILDRHGIGDNYGVAINFPKKSIHVINNAFVYHHQEAINRLQRPLQYYRRIMALDYFRRTNKHIQHVKKRWLLWSLTGNLLGFIIAADKIMIKPSYKCLVKIMFGNNDYLKVATEGQRVVEITY